jgi:nicotinamidase-related amidase
MRNLRIIVPRDCCTARTAREHKQALEHIGTMADAKVVLSASLKLEKSHG